MDGIPTLNLFEGFTPEGIKLLTRDRGWNRRNMSPEEKEELGRSISRTLGSRSPEAKRITKLRQSEAQIERFSLMSKEDKDTFLKNSFNSEESKRKSAEGTRKFYSNESEEHKETRSKNISMAIKNSLDLLSPEEMKARMDNSFNSKESIEKRNSSNRLRRTSMTPEERQLEVDKQVSRLQSPKAKENRVKGIRAYHNSLTYEEEVERARNSFCSDESMDKVAIANKKRLEGMSKEGIDKHVKRSFHSEKAREKAKQSLKSRFTRMSPEELVEWGRAHKISPTEPEVFLGMYLEENFPGEWAYNGNYSQGITIGGRIPDFVNINGKKEVIEEFGEYYHPESDEEDRIKHYAKYGWKCIVIWSWDCYLKDELDKIFKKS